MTGSPPERAEQFLVAGPADAVRAARELLEAHPGADVLPDTRPTTERFVVRMSAEQARALARAMADLLVIEPDSGIDPL